MTGKEFGEIEKMFHEIWQAALTARNAAQEVLDLKQRCVLELTRAQTEQMRRELGDGSTRTKKGK